MEKKSPKPSRRQHILETFAVMLEESPGARITTAALAKKVGVSEAALYRHFASKSKMFEGLIEFIEETIFSRIHLIISDFPDTPTRCEKILWLLLSFAERNPGITRIMTGDALAGETENLRARVVQFFDRLETQLKQLLREAKMRENLESRLPIVVAANLLLSIAEGRIAQFVRSEFKRLPTENWSDQWSVVMANFFYENNPH